MSVDVPPLEISGYIQATSNYRKNGKLIVLVPELFYVSRSFIDLIQNNLEENSNYKWHSIELKGNKDINLKYKKEHRYLGILVGLMAPEPPSIESMEKRIIFLSVDTNNIVYRALIEGEKTTIEKANITDILTVLPEHFTSEQASKVYSGVTWGKAEEFYNIKTSRNKELDKLVLQINLKDTASKPISRTN
jgi:hypothetical protein